VRRHAADLTSLIAGLVFVGIGTAYLVGVLTDVRIEMRWVLPLGLIGLGLAGLAGTVSQARRHRIREHDEDFVSSPPEPPPEPPTERPTEPPTEPEREL
jgi:hypothetical protein